MKAKLKQIEINEIPFGWEECVFSEAVNVNPRRELKKGSTAKFVSMAELKEFNKKIQSFTVRTFSGGSKFINGDTLMARITPCLENGKTAFVDILENDEVGCGSTEFIVLGGKDGKSINQFVYYLSTSPQIRQTAIKSMTGTSGRQRVESDVFDKLIIDLPDIAEQHTIAKILSDLDDKIELNHYMNKTLEAIAQALFKRWFVDFEFPNEEDKPYKSSGGKMIGSELYEIPEGWRVASATELFKLEYGWHLPEWDRKEGNIPVFGSGGLTGYHNNYLVEGPGIIIGRAGKVGPDSVYYSHIHFCPIETTFYVLAENNKIIRYLYLFLKTLNTINTGSSVPNLSRRDIHNARILMPRIELIEEFDTIVEKTFDFIENTKNQIKSLSRIRDSLLPKLMLGKIRVN